MPSIQREEKFKQALWIMALVLKSLKPGGSRWAYRGKKPDAG